MSAWPSSEFTPIILYITILSKFVFQNPAIDSMAAKMLTSLKSQQCHCWWFSFISFMQWFSFTTSSEKENSNHSEEILLLDINTWQVNSCFSWDEALDKKLQTVFIVSIKWSTEAFGKCSLPSMYWADSAMLNPCALIREHFHDSTMMTHKNPWAYPGNLIY
jgi:hypothetical protein